MKPVSLRLQNFGPFREEQHIDFTGFEKSGLFLIYGNTGSGKTTILDAMCCALYCESSNGTRFGSGKSALEKMRCQQANPKEATFVEFIFDNNNRRYRFYREIKLNSGGVNFNHTDFCGEYDGTGFVPLESNMTMEKVSGYAEKITGLNAAQFRQVVILPQGKFEELLTSSSKDKEEILTGIFNADKWDEITGAVKLKTDTQAKQLEKERFAIDRKLSDYGCDDMDSLRELLKKKSAEAESACAEETEVKEELSKLEKEDENLRSLDNSFRDMDEKKARLDKLSGKVSKSLETEAMIRKGEEAAKLRSDFDKKQDADHQKNLAAGELNTAKLSYEKSRSAMDSADSARKEHAKKRDEAEECVSLAHTLASRKTAYEEIDRKKLAFDKAAAELNARSGAEQAADGAYEKADKAFGIALKAKEAAAEKLDAARKTYDRNISGILAGSLEDGVPCPVCGSTSHPNPAKESGGSVTKEELDSLEEERNAAEKAYKEKQTDLENKKEALDEARSEKSKAEVLKATAETEYNNVKESMVEGILSLSQLTAKIEELNSKKLKYDEKEKELSDTYQNASAECSRLFGSMEAAEKKLGDAKKHAAEMTEKWLSVLGESKFRDEKDFESSLIDSDELSRMNDALVALKADHKTASEEYRKAADHLKGKERPDIATFSENLRNKRKERQAAGNRVALAQNEYSSLSRCIEELEKRLEKYHREYERCSKNQQFVNLLTGSNGVSLKRYVLGTMLDLVTVQANEMLNSVYGGRYRIIRTAEKTGRSRTSGLSFEIRDYQCDSKRDSTDISGGEKFLISLSLAIGLSDVVRTQSSGVNLEAIFVDEGFGTLDKHCLDDAMFILQTVKNRNGMVGVISHVEELAENIPAKIEMIKTGSGSRCEFHYE